VVVSQVALTRWTHPNTKSKRHAILTSFYAWMVRPGHRKDNPADRIERARKGKADPLGMRRDEALAVLSACETTRDAGLGPSRRSESNVSPLPANGAKRTAKSSTSTSTAAFYLFPPGGRGAWNTAQPAYTARDSNPGCQPSRAASAFAGLLVRLWWSPEFRDAVRGLADS
jgi:hypothetical protein